MKLAVIVASLGRPAEIDQLLRALAAQTRPPDRIILSVTGPADLPGETPPEVAVLISEKGSCVQRNRALDQLPGDIDLVAFLDDDYLPCRTAIAGIVDFFRAHADVAGANGVLLADGIHGPGLSAEAAEALLRAYDAGPEKPAEVLAELPNGLYGCNMVYRAGVIGDTRFDERLPLYGWQEDLDFSAPLTGKGRLVRCSAFAGVHRGVKRGRTSGLRFGYSQIANPIYLVRKGTMSWSFALPMMARNLLANLIKSLAPEPWVDRMGRVRGNWTALADMVLGRMRPERILALE